MCYLLRPLFTNPFCIQLHIYQVLDIEGQDALTTDSMEIPRDASEMSLSKGKTNSKMEGDNFKPSIQLPKILNFIALRFHKAYTLSHAYVAGIHKSLSWTSFKNLLFHEISIDEEVSCTKYPPLLNLIFSFYSLFSNSY